LILDDFQRKFALKREIQATAKRLLQLLNGSSILHQTNASPSTTVDVGATRTSSIPRLNAFQFVQVNDDNFGKQLINM
jgi:hypothetical protein